MALDRLTKIDGGGISTTSDYRVGIITATKFVGPIEGDVTGSITATDGTFSGNVTIGGTLTYEDVTNIDSVGIITARDGVDCNGDLDVDGHTNLDNVSVAGVSTFASSIYVADSIIHEGDTNTKIDFTTNVVKITADNKLRSDFGTSNYNTLYGSTNFTATSATPKASAGYVVRFRDDDGDDTIARFHNKNIKNAVLEWSDYGSSTTAGNLVFRGFVNGVEGGRFDGSGNFKLNQDLDVDGHTNLDNVSIAGVTTIADDKKLYLGNDQDLELYYQTSGVPGAYVQTGSSSGNLTIKNLDAGQYVYIHGDNVHLRSTTNNEAYLQAQRNGAVSLYYDSSTYGTPKFTTTATGVTIDGTAVAGGLDISGDIDVDGHTNLDNVNIAGVTTTSGNIAVIKSSGVANISVQSADNYATLEIGGQVGAFIDLKSPASDDYDIRFVHDGYIYAKSNINLSPNVGYVVNVNKNLNCAEDLDVDGHTNLDNVSIAGVVTATQYNSVNGSNTGFFKDNQVSFSPTGDAYIDHRTNNKDIYFRLSRSSALDTTMMQFDSDGEIIKFYKQVSVGLQGGNDSAVLGGGSGVGAQLTLKYADGNINTRLLGNSNSYLNVNHGNLGVGIYVASKKLHVYKSNEHPVMLERGDSNNTMIELKTNGTTRGYWGCSTTANFVVYDNDTSDINFTVNQDGDVDIAGEVSTAQDYPNIRPTLDFNFAATKKLDSRIKYTRAKSASFINEFGLLELVNENVPRFDHDPVTRECKGLLIEEQRTNFVTYSNAPAPSSPNLGGNPQVNTTEDNITLPTGEKGTVRKYKANAPGGGARWGDYSGTNNQSYTGSLWVRAQSGTTTASIDVNDGGNKTITITEEWQRVTTTSSSNNTYRFFDIFFGNPINVYFWGVQIEDGAFMTSYIPTYNATVTRGADFALIDGEEFTEFFNQDQGTIITSTNSLNTSATQYPMVIEGDNTNNERHMFVESNNYQYQIKDGGATQAQIDAGSISTKNIIAAAYKLNDTAVSINGSDAATDTSATMPTCTKLKLGHWSTTVYNGYINRFIYYPNRLSNNQLRNLTS